MERGKVLQRAIKSTAVRNPPALLITRGTWTLLLNAQDRLSRCLNLPKACLLGFFFQLGQKTNIQIC